MSEFPESPESNEHDEHDTETTFGREDSRLSGRVRRYAKVGASVGGLAAQVAAARIFGRSLDRRADSA